MKSLNTVLLFISLVLFSSCSKNPDAIVSPSTTVNGKSIYVDPSNGNDNNSDRGRNISSPFKTLSRASLSAANGDTIYIKGGTYTGFKDEIKKSDTELGYIFIRPYPSQTVVLDGTGGTFLESEAILTIRNSSYVDIASIEIKNNSQGAGISILSETKYCQYIKINDCTVHDVHGAGIFVGCANFFMENCEIYNTCLNNKNRALTDAGRWHSAIETYFKYNYVQWFTAEYIWSGSVINNNRIHNNWGEGIKLTRNNDFKITNNKIYDCYNAAIVLDNSRNGLVFNNFIYTTSDEYNRITSGYSRPMNGVVFSNEKTIFAANPISENLSIYNNLMLRTSAPFRWYYDVSNESPINVYKRIKIYFNTAYNTMGREAFLLDADFPATRQPASENEFRNNIIYKSMYNGSQQSYFSTSTDYAQYWTITNNCFASGDVPAFIAKQNITGNPAFTNPALISPEGFKIAAGSVCYSTGLMVASIAQDFFLNPRLPAPSIGFYELTR